MLENIKHFFLVPSREETSFLTTSYGLYFSHHYTKITHYKSSYAQGLGFHSISTICQTYWNYIFVLKFE